MRLNTGFAVCAILVATSAEAAPPKPAKAKERPSIAVLDFTFAKSNRIEGREKVKTDVLTEKIKTALISSRKFDVLERQELDAVLDEKKLAQSPLGDRALKAGKLAHADYLVTGVINVLEIRTATKTIAYVDQVKAQTTGTMISDIRILEVGTGKAVFAGRVSTSLQFGSNLSSTSERVTPSDLFYEELFRGHGESLSVKVVESVFPLKVVEFDGETVYLNRGEGSGLKEGDRLQILRLDGEMRDPDTGESLGSKETPVGVAEVYEVLAKSTKARPVEGRPAFARGMVARPIRP